MSACTTAPVILSRSLVFFLRSCGCHDHFNFCEVGKSAINRHFILYLSTAAITNLTTLTTLNTLTARARDTEEESED